MRIAFLTTQFPHTRMGGIGAYTVAMASALAQPPHKHDAHIFTFTLPDDVRAQLPALAPHVHIHEVPELAQRIAHHETSAELAATLSVAGDAVYRLALAALLTDALLQLHRTTPFDIVEAPDYEALLLPLILHFAQHPDPHRPALITHLHSGSAINRLGNNLPTTEPDRAIDALEASAISLADARCAPSRAVVAATQTPLYPPLNPTILSLPVPVPTHITPPPAEGPILFVGRLEKLKGADLLIQAAALLFARNATAKLQIIGPDTPTAPGGGSMRAWMLAQLPSALHPRIAFLGELPPSVIPDYIKTCSFVVVPSLYESFSLVAALALAHGRPVITSAGIGTAELVGDAQTPDAAGLTFLRGDPIALADALEKLWTDRPLLTTLSHRAHARAQSLLDPSVVVPQRIAFYHQSIAQKHAFIPIPSPFLPPLIALATRLAGLFPPPGPPSAPPTTPLSPGLRLLEIMQKTAKNGVGGRVLLYGAGRHTTRLLSEKHVWERLGHAIIGFIDDAPRWAEGNGVHLGLPVVPSKLVEVRFQAENAVIVLSTDTFEEPFWEKTAPLRAAGWRVVRLYGNT